MKYSSALYIGRFQPFHNGHYKALKWILEKSNRVILGIGSAQHSHTKENPFTVGERIEMISNQLIHDKLIDKVIIASIPDTNDQHNLWVSVVQHYCPSFEVVFSNDPLTRLLFLEKGIKVESIPFFEREKYEATKIREMISSGLGWEEYVPEKIAEYIKEKKLDERLKKIYSK
jgi:nicotinamide-nucleotide adenylyltransferase